MKTFIFRCKVIMANQLLIPVFLLQVWYAVAEIGGNPTLNKIVPDNTDPLPDTVQVKKIPEEQMSKIKPVGAPIAKNFLPLTELPPPQLPGYHFHNGRRHMDEDCTTKTAKEVYEGAKIELWGDYYEEKFAKTVATVIFPDHIDHKHFEVTTQVPYYTVGSIDAIGYHPTTIKSEHPSECEKIYQDHLADQYSDESADMSEESLEMARMPLFPPQGRTRVINSADEANMYDDVSV